MKIKEILETEFESHVDEKSGIEHNSKIYTVHDYYRIHFLIKDDIISFIYYHNETIEINAPIHDIYWLILCIKYQSPYTNFIKVFNNKALKREFKINNILND